jgi:AmmeMemoRadiSam system protein B
MSNTLGKHSRPSVLESTLAGSWYPAGATQLRTIIEQRLAELPPAKQPSQRRNILLLPHAGYV